MTPSELQEALEMLAQIHVRLMTVATEIHVALDIVNAQKLALAVVTQQLREHVYGSTKLSYPPASEDVQD